MGECVLPHPGIPRSLESGKAVALATMWMDPENTMLSEGSRHRRTQGVIPLVGNVQNRQIHRHREWVPGCQGLGVGSDC